jgi:type II secretory pathway pseudopilin PulG
VNGENKMISRSHGYTILELLIVMGLSIFVLAGMTVPFHLIASDTQKLIGSESVANHNIESRTFLKKTDLTAKPYCMQMLKTQLTQDKMAVVIQSALTTTATYSEVSIGTFNYLNPTSLNYGDLKIQDVTLSDIYMIKSHHGYYISQPAEISIADKKPMLMYNLSVNLNTLFKPTSDIGLQNSAVRISLVIMQLQSGLRLVDCGVGSMARTTAAIDACKAFGPDFEYFADRVKDSDELSGQCYLPIYDADRQPAAFTPDGSTKAQVTGYTPLRAFLCESASTGKSVDFSFCTGVN